MSVNYEELPIGENAPKLVNAVVELPDQNLTEVEEFFEVYKRLEEDREVEIHGRLSLEEAREVIRDATRRDSRG